MSQIAFADLQAEIEAGWEARDGVSAATTGPLRTAVEETLLLLDAGKLRSAERAADGRWEARQWAKQAILLSRNMNPNQVMRAGARSAAAANRTVVGQGIPSKFEGWDAPQFEALPAFAPCQARSFAAGPTSRPAWC